MTLDQILQRLEKIKSTVSTSTSASVSASASASASANYILQKPSQYKNTNSSSVQIK